jgi:hypothetical protein
VDRQIVYPGAIPLDTDVLSMERDAMVAIGYLAQVLLGTGMVVDGLSCVPTQPATMGISIGPGSITQFGVVDATAFGSLPAEPTEPLVRIGINLTGTSFALTAPTTSDYAISYLIEATLLEIDTTPVVLPYYNAANPGQPFSGPDNDGAAQNTQRLQQVELQLKVGAPNVAGTQQTPSVDAGWAGLFVITVLAGQTTVTAENISVLPTAPFLTWKLPQLSPGTQNLAVFSPTNQGNWVVPMGVSKIKLRVWGGGGAGGAGFGGAGGGGAGGGYIEGFFAVPAGESYFVAVGNGGVGSGTSGGTSSFGSVASATGGQAGANGASGVGGGGGTSGGIGNGAGWQASGQGGAGAFAAGSTWVSGRGGSAFGGAGAEPVLGVSTADLNGYASTLPGGGGGGAVGSGLGGQGGAGLVLIEW